VNHSLRPRVHESLFVVCEILLRCLTSCPSSSCVEVSRRFEDHPIAVFHAVADFERGGACEYGRCRSPQWRTLRPLRLKTTASEGTVGDLVLRGIGSSNLHTFSGHSLLAGRKLAQVEIYRTAIAMIEASGFIWAISGTRPATAPAAAKPAAGR
jgi:hypothetical protein